MSTPGSVRDTSTSSWALWAGEISAPGCRTRADEQQAAPAKQFLADGDAGLLLEHDQGGEAGIQVMDAVPVALTSRAYERLEHLRERKPCIESLAPRLQIERRVERAKPREELGLPVGEPLSQLANLGCRRHRLFLDTSDRRNRADDSNDQPGRHVHVGRRRMVLQDDWNRHGPRNLLIELDDAIFVGNGFSRGRHHDRIGAEIGGHCRQKPGGGGASGARAHNDGHSLPDHRYRCFDERLPLLVVETVRLAQHAENRDAVDSERHHELEKALPGMQVEAFIVLKRGGEDRDDTVKHRGASL